MRNWDSYITLEGIVKNMLTSLRAVGELQNSAIRERHWHFLIKSTKVWSFIIAIIFFNKINDDFISIKIIRRGKENYS